MTILQSIDQLFAEKKVPLKSRPIQNNQFLYQGTFTLKTGQVLPFGIVVASDAERSDYQISYRKLGYLSDYNHKAKVLELMNDLNQTKTYYYTLCLAGDGEVFLRLLSRTTTDVGALYDMLIIGSNVAKRMIEELKDYISAE